MSCAVAVAGSPGPCGQRQNAQVTMATAPQNDLSAPEDQGGIAPLSPLNAAVFARLAALMAQPPSQQVLSQSLRLLAKWRSAMIVNTILKKDGPLVSAGPFKGMTYITAGSEGSTSARLLGAYETALHPVIEDIVARGYEQVIDVGCAEGYYAVGLARRTPQARIIARDLNPDAREKCAELARANGVLHQIEIGGAMAHGDFDICAHAKTLVICDIEGAEAQLLDPERATGLRAADILVEVHDCFVAGLSGQIALRFAASHDVQTLQRSAPAGLLPDWMNALSDLDRLLALWEWRIGPTPWLWMTRRGAGRADKSGSAAGKGRAVT